MRRTITVTTDIAHSARTDQVRGIFDLTEEKTQTLAWDIALPLEEQPWNIGLITGPSGCGKSTIARHLWPTEFHHASHCLASFKPNESILDAFPESMPIKDITAILSSVGFSSPPAWLRPYQVLSTGQQFRVLLARMLADSHPPGRPLVFDEYTSVVDRTVAQIGSAAVAKVIRARGLQFVAVTCHDDVIDWLQPDWIYEPADGKFTRRLLQRRPKISLDIVRCTGEAWQLFAPHHYLSEECNASSIKFLATWKGKPVAFSAWMPFVGTGPPRKREHRTVTLPDYQGVGIGNAVSDTICSMWKALGYGATSTTTHPAMIASRLRSSNWVMTRAPGMHFHFDPKMPHAGNRLTAGFRYIGPAMDPVQAKKLHGT